MIFRKSLATIIIGLFFLTVSTRVKSQTLTNEIEQQKIRVEQIDLEGNTIFDSELKKIIGDFENRIISLEEIFTLKNRLTNFYTSRGYTNSGAFIPPQRFDNGNLKIIIIEGTLAAIKIKGLKKIDEKYLIDKLPETDTPLNLNRLNNSLALLKKDILIKDLSAEIVVQEIGKNILLLEVEENAIFEARLRLNNAYSPSIGSFGGSISLTHNNLLGFGDRLSISRSQTEGLRNTGGSYSIPLNTNNGRMTFAYSAAHSEVITEEISELGIEADSEIFSLSIKQGIIFKPDEQFNLGLKIEYINSESFVLGDFSFSFVEGLPDGKNKITALRLSQEYVKNWNDALFLLHSQFNIGLDIFDATKTERGIDGIFAYWQGDLQYLTALDRDRDLVLATRLTTQLTTDKLLPTEQFLLGGQGSVIGYRRNIGNGDNGVLGILELQFALIEGKLGNFSIVPFTNIGAIWNNDRDTPGADFLASVGLSFRYQLASTLEIKLDYGVPLVDPDGFENSGTTDNFTFSAIIVPFRF